MDNLTQIKQQARDLIEKLGFQCDLISHNNEEGNLVINIQVRNPSILIGQNGNNLSALEHLLRVIVARRIDQPSAFMLDINHYRFQKIESLKALAQSIARKVTNYKKPIFLQPMSAFERRIIHLELANKNGLATESRGQEPKRRIVIRPTG